jgi:hypothetical protein
MEASVAKLAVFAARGPNGSRVKFDYRVHKTFEAAQRKWQREWGADDSWASDSSESDGQEEDEEQQQGEEEEEH